MNTNRMAAKRSRLLLILFISVVIIIGIGVVIFLNTPQKRISKRLDLGNKFIEEQSFEQAIAIFDEIIVLDPKNKDAYIGKAKAYSGLDNYMEVINTYKAAISSITDDDELIQLAVQSYLYYAQILADNDDYEEAIRTLQEGYNLLKDNSLLSKLNDLQARNKLKEINADEINKLMTSCRIHIVQSFLTDSYFKNLCYEYINILENTIDTWINDNNSIVLYAQFLYLYYCAINDLEKSFKLRTRIYELLQDKANEDKLLGEYVDVFAPFETRINSNETDYCIYDKYGREITRYVNNISYIEFEYGTDGKIRSIEMQYYYEEEGATESYYECYYMEDGRINEDKHIDISPTQTVNIKTTYIYFENGATLYSDCEQLYNDSNTKDFYSSSQDITWDKYGNNTSIGDILYDTFD